MSFLGGLFLIYLAYKIFQRSVRPAPIPLPPDADYAGIEAKLEAIRVLNTRIEQGRELDQQLVTDAMARELRAKTALLALLQKLKVDEAGIQRVMNAVENVEEGDDFGFDPLIFR